VPPIRPPASFFSTPTFASAAPPNRNGSWRKRQLALAIIDEIFSRWQVPKENVYVIYTERQGELFQLSDRVLPNWSAGEDPLAD